MDIFNPKILDASIRDVTSCLSNESKVNLLLSALQQLQFDANYRVVVENAVQSCLQVPLPTDMIVKAHIIRAKVRVAAGHRPAADQDIEAALALDPDNLEAKSLQQSHVQRAEQTINVSTPNFSTEVWREIALFLPRRDLLSLLWVPNALSAIASQLLFRTVDLHLSDWIPSEDDADNDEDMEPSGRDPDGPHASRTADILTRFITDAKFASLVKTLRIHAVTKDNASIAFQTGMLANAVPQLLNLKNLHVAANFNDLIPILDIFQAAVPRLVGLSVNVYRCDDHSAELSLPAFRSLKHLSYYGTNTNPAFIRELLEQNQASLQRICIDNKMWSFNTELALRHLTHLDIHAQVPADSQAFALVLQHGRQLEYLRMRCVLKCYASPQFKDNLQALPFLKHFSFAVLSIHRNVTDPELFPAICDFLRGRELRTLRLTVCDSETVQKAVGFDEAVWGLLPHIKGLKNLCITYPKTLKANLASWLLPRTLRSLSLDSMRISKPYDTFFEQLKTGVPPDLRLISMRNSFSAHDVVKHGFPMVKAVLIGTQYMTVSRREDGSIGLEPWPLWRSEFHAQEWLEWMGCEGFHMDFTQF